MCFSQPASAFFAVMGFGTAALLRYRGHPFRRYQVFAYFGIMEVIQFIAYFYVDQCEHPMNKVVTMLAYTHVMFQNIPVNTYFLAPENGVHPDVLRLVTWMTIIGGGMGIVTKLPWPVWLGASPLILDPLAKVLPDIYSYTTAGTPEACLYETMCASQVCTFSTPNHIAWSVPAMPPSYYLPNSFLHFFFFFFPTVIMANNLARLTMLAAFITGPLFTQMLAARYAETYKFEWPATWCYMSVGQCAIALGMELYTVYQLSGKSKLRQTLLSGGANAEMAAAAAIKASPTKAKKSSAKAA